MHGSTSFKWISSDIKSGRMCLNLNENEVPRMLSTLGRKPCNLISIFGRARQGKSFLMNCLSGETELFRISNEKESCTQGIDISNKWLDIGDFSKIDGGRRIAGTTKVGFIDAEGQGDKNVTYDATLVCPILLISKCILFNWKGDLQKDHMLECLGIMTRAASNIASDSSSLEAVAGSATFAHLHIIFRDWQAVGCTSESVYHALFDAEGTPESVTRDRIREEVRKSFASIRVWLFDAPTSSIKALRTKLNIDMTTDSFRSQIRALREALSLQLREPTLFAGQVLNGMNLSPVVKEIANILNGGEVILPRSAFVNMLHSEVNFLRQLVVENMVQAGEQILANIKTPDASGHLKPLSKAESLLLTELNGIRDEFMDKAHELLGGMLDGGDLATQTLQEFSTSLASQSDSVLKHFQAEYKVLFSTWLRNRRLSLEQECNEELRSLERAPTIFDDAELQAKFDKIINNATTALGAQLYGHTEEITDAINQIKRLINSRAVTIRKENDRRIETKRLELQNLMTKYCDEMMATIPITILRLLPHSPTGIKAGLLEDDLNSQYTVHMKTLVNRATEFGSNPEKVEAEFEAACIGMNLHLQDLYNQARQESFRKAIDQGIVQLQELIRNSFGVGRWDCEADSDREFDSQLTSLISKVHKTTIAKVADWKLSVSDQIDSDILTPLNFQMKAIVDALRNERRAFIDSEKEHQRRQERERLEKARIDQERANAAERLRLQREAEEHANQQAIRLKRQQEMERLEVAVIEPKSAPTKKRKMDNQPDKNTTKKGNTAGKKAMPTIEEQQANARRWAGRNRIVIDGVRVEGDDDDVDDDDVSMQVVELASSAAAESIIVLDPVAAAIEEQQRRLRERQMQAAEDAKNAPAKRTKKN